jgi:hypothetical protein
MIGISEWRVWPQSLLQFVPRNQLPWTSKKHLEDLEWLAGKLKSSAVFPQFLGMQVGLKCTEPDRTLRPVLSCL